MMVAVAVAIFGDAGDYCDVDSGDDKRQPLEF